MGKALASSSDEAAEAFREADRALDMPLSELCFDGTDAILARTEVTQPSILATSVAAYRAFRGAGGATPAAAAGHSLGEYSAHVAAGTMTYAEALRCVRQRGRFMQEAVPEGEGAMAAILGLERGAVEDACEAAREGEVVSCANFNGPGQVVIAGHAGAVARASERALRAGAKRAVPLQVSAPFHCALMRGAAIRLAPVLDGMAFRDPAFAVYSNVDAAPVATGEEARDALARQVVSAVRWEDVVTRMAGDGIDTFVEFGPGKVLAGLVKRIRKDGRVFSVGDPSSLGQALAALSA
jgi:[acyl-carrier-protein] S-malonyltransferase